MKITHILFVIFCAILLAGCGDEPETRTAARPKPPEEKMLADINAGHTVRDDDITIARFRSLLAQLRQRFPEEKSRIGDMTVVAQESLKKEGISESLLRIMEGLNQAAQSSQSEGRQYAEYAAAYATLRDQGLSHDETVEGLYKAMMLVPRK